MAPIATLKHWFVPIMAALLLLSQSAVSQNCTAGLERLSVCVPFVVPGVNNGPPNADCCSALEAIDHGCLCNTINIINRLPNTCNLPAVSCSA